MNPGLSWDQPAPPYPGRSTEPTWPALSMAMCGMAKNTYRSLPVSKSLGEWLIAARGAQRHPRRFAQLRKFHTKRWLVPC